MGKNLILSLALAFGSAAYAQSFCAPAPDHTSPVLKTAIQKLIVAAPVQSALARHLNQKETVFCTSGVVLAYGENPDDSVYLISLDVRQSGTLYLMNQFRVLVDGKRVSVLGFKASTDILERWFSSLKFKSAGAMPRVNAIDLALRLGAFTNTRSDERTITSLPVRAPALEMELYYLVTWSALVESASAVYARGVVIVQSRRTGEVLVSDRLNIVEGLLQPLRDLAASLSGGGVRSLPLNL